MLSQAGIKNAIEKARLNIARDWLIIFLNKNFSGGNIVDKDTSGTIRRAERFHIVLIGEGLMVGGIAGFVVILYRMALEFAGDALNHILQHARQNLLWAACW